jgi:hypothetical protein
MSPLGIASIVLVCVFGSALLGFFLRSALPDNHLSEDSMRAVTLSTGLIATLAALVLGLLISSTKSSFDRINDEVAQAAATIVLLDRNLAHYGPETKEARDLLHSVLVFGTELLSSGEASPLGKLDTSERRASMEQIQARLRALAPRSDAQRLLQSRAVQLSNDLAQMRWLAIAQGTGSIPTLFLVVLVLWLTIIFAGFGLSTANNSTVVAVLFACALAVSGAIFLIEEMDRPFDGLMKVSSAPLRNALAHLGQQ